MMNIIAILTGILAFSLTSAVFASDPNPNPSDNNIYTDPVTNMEFVFVKGGCYQMGDLLGVGYDDEIPHEVCLDDFYIGKFEVTQGAYKTVTGQNPSYFKKGNDYPVEKVSWPETHVFVRKLNALSSMNYRLPTEAEWEYAARSGGKKEVYSGSNTPDTVAWHDGNSDGSTHRVGAKAPNGLGIYDMSGNVREWCEDWYNINYYKNSPKDNPKGHPSGSRRINRGGGYRKSPEHYSRVTHRDACEPDEDHKFADHGFRLVLPVQP